mmetsp:Transcript_21908/g.62597  ORF Transcript_21908/g.62597 Transcript_21908/m.62597 type:complete len:343 (-) Transcript_21908:520-1548(-)
MLCCRRAGLSDVLHDARSVLETGPGHQGVRPVAILGERRLGASGDAHRAVADGAEVVGTLPELPSADAGEGLHLPQRSALRERPGLRAPQPQREARVGKDRHGVRGGARFCGTPGGLLGTRRDVVLDQALLLGRRRLAKEGGRLSTRAQLAVGTSRRHAPAKHSGVRLLDLLEAFFVVHAGLVRVFLPRQGPVGLLDLLVRSVGPLEAEDEVGVALLRQLRDVLQLVPLPHEPHQVCLDRSVLRFERVEAHFLGFRHELRLGLAKLAEHTVVVPDGLLRRRLSARVLEGLRGVTLDLQPGELEPHLGSQELLGTAGRALPRLGLPEERQQALRLRLHRTPPE